MARLTDGPKRARSQHRTRRGDQERDRAELKPDARSPVAGTVDPVKPLHGPQVHAVDETGRVVARKKLRRSEVIEFFEALSPCLIGMEACGSAHHWGRELTALGHDVRLMPAGYVKPYIKRGKNDAVDAEAICEAVARPMD